MRVFRTLRNSLVPGMLALTGCVSALPDQADPNDGSMAFRIAASAALAKNPYLQRGDLVPLAITPQIEEFLGHDGNGFVKMPRVTVRSVREFVDGSEEVCIKTNASWRSDCVLFDPLKARMLNL